MTTEEKAKELVDKFFWGAVKTPKQAKASALIAVDEIMKLDVWDNPFDKIHYGLIYWQQVKEKINSLSE